MNMYLIHYPTGEFDSFGVQLEERFESIRVSPTAWIVAMDGDMDLLDEELSEFVDDSTVLIAVEVIGDFTMQGLPDEQMTWIDEHCSD